jgi:PAS domain S-box-containing protein
MPQRKSAPHSHEVVRLLVETGKDVLYRYRVVPAPRADYVSPAAFALTGRHPDEFYADPLLPLKALHPDDRMRAKAAFRQRDWVTLTMAVRWRHDDGRLVHAEHHIVAVRDVNGVLVALEGTARDISDRSALEARLRDSEAELRTFAERLELAREEERTHLARELHDHFGQMLTQIKLELAQVTRHLHKGASVAILAERVQSVVSLVDATTESIRTLAGGLRPPALDALGLGAAIEAETASIAHRSGLRFRLNVKGESRRLDDKIATALFRITQEALNNIVRHAAASTVHIGLTINSRIARLRIRDDGIGIGEGIRTGAVGLIGMQERAQMVGGRCRIGHAAGSGTLVEVIVPAATDREHRR